MKKKRSVSCEATKTNEEIIKHLSNRGKIMQ